MLANAGQMRVMRSTAGLYIAKVAELQDDTQLFLAAREHIQSLWNVIDSQKALVDQLERQLAAAGIQPAHPLQLHHLTHDQKQLRGDFDHTIIWLSHLR